LIALGSFLLGSAGSVLGAGLIEKTVTVHQTAVPIFPNNLLAITNRGETRIVLSIDAEGKLDDYLVVGYTKREFADAALVAIKQWKFEPAISNGQPVPVVSEVNIMYEATGVVVSLNASEAIAAMLYWWERSNRFEYHPVAMKDIDRIPIPQNVVAPIYPRELANKGVKGDVSIVFYINEEGVVRMPAVSEAADMRLADLAMQALLSWKFEPPTRRGRPVLVRAVQTFKFMPGDTPKAAGQ
jgi:TonB family protein